MNATCFAWAKGQSKNRDPLSTGNVSYVPSSSISSHSTSSAGSLLSALIPDLASSGKLKLVLRLEPPALDLDREGRRPDSGDPGSDGNLGSSTVGDRVKVGELVVEMCRPYRSSEGMSTQMSAAFHIIRSHFARTSLYGICLCVVPHKWGFRFIDFHKTILLYFGERNVRFIPL
jgi:hypothetical protein